MGTLLHPAPGSNPGGPALGTPPPRTLAGLRCPMCEGPVYQSVPGRLTCPACAARPAPTLAAVAGTETAE